ncbi:hypothetical protein NUW54_g616 [Trametes sanguinea]|uniref:Uncharacterized protein n=1 Tax=Trametes sanguinea TaxID=158606 RepID=A0ACC1QBN2_9APHY|nr:hypothetical protein NUW54_g616 [Trametes sanguinea]
MSFYANRSTSALSTSSVASSTVVVQQRSRRQPSSYPDSAIDSPPHAGFYKAVPDQSSNDIDSLPQSIRRVQSAFREIASDLVVYERQRVEAKSRYKIKAFFFGTSSFTKLLDSSSAHAMKAYAVLHQHGAIYRERGPAEDDELREGLKKEVQNLRQVIEEHQAKSKEIREGFSRFCDEVCTFKLEVEQKHKAAMKKSKSVFEEYVTKLNALERDLNTVAEDIAASEIAFSASLAHRLLLKRLPDMKAKASARIMHTRRRKQRKPVDQLGQKHDHLVELDKSLGKMVRVLHEFANHANALVNVWDAIVNQFCELDALLETVICGSHITPFFGMKLDNTYDAYEELKDILYKYARALAGRAAQPLSRLVFTIPPASGTAYVFTPYGADELRRAKVIHLQTSAMRVAPAGFHRPIRRVYDSYASARGRPSHFVPSRAHHGMIRADLACTSIALPPAAEHIKWALTDSDCSSMSTTVTTNAAAYHILIVHCSLAHVMTINI